MVNFIKIIKLSFVLSLVIGMTACGKVKIKVPQVDLRFSNSVVELSFDLKNQQLDVGGQFDVPDLEGAKLTLVPTNPITGSSARVVLTVPADKFEDEDFKLKNPTLLPDGRNLPDVGGPLPLPSVAVHVPDWLDSTFYLGTKVAGIFVPTTAKFDPDGWVTVGFSDQAGRQVGFISRVPSDGVGTIAGFFVQFFWNQAISNPMHAMIREQDLRQAHVKHPLLEQRGITYDMPFDISEYAELED